MSTFEIVFAQKIIFVDSYYEIVGGEGKEQEIGPHDLCFQETHSFFFFCPVFVIVASSFDNGTAIAHFKK